MTFPPTRYDPEFADDYQSHEPENMSLTDIQHVIQAHTQEIHRVASALAAVGMDMLAKRLFRTEQEIFRIAGQIGPKHRGDLDNAIAHNAHIAGSVLHLLLSKDITDKPGWKDGERIETPEDPT